MNFVNILINPPGDLIYFVIVIVASLFGLLMAAGQRMRRVNDYSAGRYTVAMVGVVVTWALLLGGALLALLFKLDGVSILPPLERAANLLTVLLLAWAFLTADHMQWGRASVVTLAFLIAVTNVAYVITAGQWIGLAGRVEFNSTVYAVAWTFAPLLVTLIGILLTLVYFKLVFDAPLKLVFFLALAVGYAGTLFQIAQETADGDYAGLVRVAFVVAMGVSPAIIYRAIMTRLTAEVEDTVTERLHSTQPMPAQTAELPAIQPSLSSARGGSPIERESVQLLRVLGLILEKATPENVPTQIVNAILDILRADVGALMRIQDANYADITTVYDRAMKRSLSGISLNLDNQPTLVNAIERRVQRPLFEDRNSEELSDLYARLDISQIGPVYFQPLVHDGQIVAVLAVALPYTKRELNTQEEEILKGVAVIAAGLLALSYMANDASMLAEERAIQAIVQGVSPNQLGKDSVLAARQEMQASLQLAREQIAELSRQVVTLKLELDRERTRLANMLGESEQDLSVSQRIRAINVEQETLRAERDSLAARLKEAEASLASITAPDDRAILETMIESLRRERDELANERERLEAQLNDVRSGVWSPEMVDRMDDENARLEAERDHLAERLSDIQSQLRAYGIEAGSTGLGQLVAQLVEQRSELQAHVTQLEAEKGQASQAVALAQDYDARIQNLQTQLKNLASDRDAALNQLEQARKAHNELNAKLETVKQHRARLLAQVSAFEIETQELRQEIQRLRGTQGSDQGSADETSRQRAKLEREFVRARKRLVELEREVETLRANAAAGGSVQNGPSGYSMENADLIMSLVQELRTPLTSIYGNIELMMAESFGIIGQMQRQILQKVGSNVKRLTGMIEDLIRVTAMDTGKFTLSATAVDVVEIVERLITDSAIQFRAKGLTVDMQIDPDLPQPVADLHAVEEIFGQLLTNAYLVSPPGTRVIVTARAQTLALNPASPPVDCVVVSVEDRGGGIAPEDEPRVFVRKYKAENPLIAGLGDTGVGLSIAKVLVEAHHGKLWIDSIENVGSRFSFALPLKRDAEA